MSTVLWANYLADSSVKSDESDKYALFKHLNKLDQLCRKCNVTSLTTLCDSTDIRLNTEELELPPTMQSTDELMASTGVWIDANQAIEMLEKLLTHIRANNVKFGFINNAHSEVVAELQESIAFAMEAADKQAKFNFSIVM